MSSHLPQRKTTTRLTSAASVIELERPHDGACFSVVSRAGQHIVALGDTLRDVYVLNEPALKWLPLLVTSSFPGSVDLTRKVDILDLWTLSTVTFLWCRKLTWQGASYLT